MVQAHPLHYPSSNLEWVGEVTFHQNSTLGVVVKYTDGMYRRVYKVNLRYWYWVIAFFYIYWDYKVIKMNRLIFLLLLSRPIPWD